MSAPPLASSEDQAGSRGDSKSEETTAITREPRVLPAPSNPMAVARSLVAESFTDAAGVILRAWRGGFRGWRLNFVGVFWGEASLK